MLTPYCPKCGKQLISIDFITYHCASAECNYSLGSKYIIDISFKSQGFAKALSNLCNYKFIFDCIECNSMESFIQSLRTPDELLQKEICSMSGPFSYSIRTMLPDWRKTQTIYWKGKAINRQSGDYQRLLINAYFALYGNSEIFSYALNQSKGYKLAHSIGCTDKTLTLLTPDEYIDILESLRC